jgi:hypothetical protein
MEMRQGRHVEREEANAREREKKKKKKKKKKSDVPKEVGVIRIDVIRSDTWLNPCIHFHGAAGK